MKNNLEEIIKERLENRLEWRNYLGWSLTHRHLASKAKKLFYKDKQIILKIYFLPYNTMKYFTYVCDRHKYDMIETEIRMLKTKTHEEKDKGL